MLELQIWINENIAPSLNFTSTYTRSDGYPLSYINDEDLTASRYIAIIPNNPHIFQIHLLNLQTHPISLESSFATKSFNDLESIVIYGRDNNSTYEILKGSTLQLVTI